MQIQTVTGQQNNADGSTPTARAGKQGDTIVSELHGRFYEQAYRGNLFGGGSSLTALSANTITLTATTTPILGVYNPSGTGKNLVMSQAALTCVANNLTSGAGPGIFVWALSVGNLSVSTGNTPYNRGTMAQSGSVAKSFGGGVALTGLTNNLVVVEAADLPAPGGLTYTTLGSTALLPCYQGVQNFDGSLIVPPGGVLALLNTTSSTVFSAGGRLLWEEVPA